MGYTIDIDTGGTFTDGIVVQGQEARTVKVPTTPHDLTVCFAECVRACAEAFGQSPESLLAHTEIIRFCNTIGTNTIIQRDGAKIGLILTRGHEGLAPTALGEAPAPLVAQDLVAGLAEEMSERGEPRVAPDPAETLAAAQLLIDRGARALVVALANSERNPNHERLVRATIKHEYPRDYLGSVPVFLASDISTRSGYAQRVNAAAINAYIHSKLARLLYKAGEELRQQSYRGVLFIGHNNGAVARVAKTRAINTYNSGPTAGLLGAGAIGRLYGIENVVSTDMGGTSYDIGVVRAGQVRLALDADVEGFRCNLPMMSVRALGAGGGSLASISGGVLKVGPRSAGAVPGPACFDRGGNQPTVTDANLVLGLLDPDYFLGGAQRLDVGRARRAIEDHIARPLDLSVEAAALAIKTQIERTMAEGVTEAARGLDPRATAIVAYGGAGPLHTCAVAELAGLQRAVLTPFCAVFSAFSSSLMDVGHVYYRRLDLPLAGRPDSKVLSEAEQSMCSEAHRDMRGEGFKLESLCYELRLFIVARDGRELMVHAPAGIYREESAWSALLGQARAELERRNSAPAHDLMLTSLSLSVSAATPHIEMKQQSHPDKAVPAGPRGRRSVYGADGWSEIPVYERSALSAGTKLSGPALIDSSQTTVHLPRGWRLSVDTYDHALMTREAP